jgi:hypothetical protein
MVEAFQWDSLDDGCLYVSIEYLSWQTFYYNMDIVAVSIVDELIADACLDLLITKSSSRMGKLSDISTVDWQVKNWIIIDEYSLRDIPL